MKKSDISSDRELIEVLAKVHELTPSHFSKIIMRFGLITLFEDLQMYGSVEAYNEYLWKLARDMKGCTGNFPASIYDELIEALEKPSKAIEEGKPTLTPKEITTRSKARKARTKYYHKNKERINKEQQAKYLANLEKKRAYSRQYYAENKEQINKTQRARRRAEKDND